MDGAMLLRWAAVAFLLLVVSPLIVAAARWLGRTRFFKWLYGE